MKKTLLLAALAGAIITPAQAAITITEVAPWASGNSAYMADWFEVTNTGIVAVNISGWKVDDDSNLFSAALSLQSITSIAPGESVIFIEGDSATAASFTSTWFGSSIPAGFQIGTYSGSGIGFGVSSSGDQVNLFDSTGTRQANVSFGISPSASPFASFDNAAGTNGAISTLSVVGTKGAFVAPNDSARTEIGSPGRIAAPVPEPSTAVAIAGGISLLLGLRRRRA
jgi:opacity protein-like surface antigen